MGEVLRSKTNRVTEQQKEDGNLTQEQINARWYVDRRKIAARRQREISLANPMKLEDKGLL